MTWDGTHRPGCMTAARCDCDKIQAHHPSETGATAEEVAQKLADDLVDVFAVCHVEADLRIVGGVQQPNPMAGEPMQDVPAAISEIIATIKPRVAAALLAAKRSAHLEDARAVCTYCRQGRLPSGCGGGSPVHHHEGSDGTRCLPCTAEPIWNALK